MKLKQLGGAGAAYVAASAANVVLGLVAADLWEQWGGEVDRRILIEVSWLATVGAPSLIAARDLTLRALGKKDDPPWAKGLFLPVWNTRNERESVLASAVRTMFKPKAEAPDVELPMSYIFHSIDNNGKGHTFTDEEVRGVLRSAWRRRERYPWSRRRMMGQLRMSRDEYDAMMNLLMSVPGIVYDRGEGTNRPGKIKLPPLSAIELVRHSRGQLLLGWDGLG